MVKVTTCVVSPVALPWYFYGDATGLTTHVASDLHCHKFRFYSGKGCGAQWVLVPQSTKNHQHNLVTKYYQALCYYWLDIAS